MCSSTCIAFLRKQLYSNQNSQWQPVGTKKNSTILVNDTNYNFWEISFISEIDLFSLNSALSKRTLQWFCSLLHCYSDNDNTDASNSILPQNVTSC